MGQSWEVMFRIYQIQGWFIPNHSQLPWEHMHNIDIFNRERIGAVLKIYCFNLPTVCSVGVSLVWNLPGNKVIKHLFTYLHSKHHGREFQMLESNGHRSRKVIGSLPIFRCDKAPPWLSPSVGLSVCLSVTHFFDDPHVALIGLLGLVFLYFVLFCFVLL